MTLCDFVMIPLKRGSNGFSNLIVVVVGKMARIEVFHFFFQAEETVDSLVGLFERI
jgi:hypothetical protein